LNEAFAINKHALMSKSKRKAFNFFLSYYEIGKELNDKDRLQFYDAILKKQFENIDTELTGMAKFAYISQSHSIYSQTKGYFDKTKDPMFDPTVGGMQGGMVAPAVQEKEKEKGQVQEKEKGKYLMSEIEISDVPQNEIDYFNVANAFFQLFQQNAIDLDVRWVHLDKLTYKRCVTPIRLLATSDNRTRDEMLLVFDLLKKDLFWKQNIQSTEKLREKFDQLITKAQNYGKTDKRVTSEPYDLSCFDD
jgi:hypothetical protein